MKKKERGGKERGEREKERGEGGMEGGIPFPMVIDYA